MRSFLGGVTLALLAASSLAGCATAPHVGKGATNYLEKGMASAKFKGNEFYMAIGQVDLYKYGFWGNLKPSGKTVDIAVVIQADADTGQILRIATLQPQDPDETSRPSSYENGVAVTNGSPFALGDLRGGISITDVQSYPRWLDALDAMRKAINDLSTYTSYASDGQHYIVAVEPTVSFRFGWWGWGRPFRHSHY
jgi:hypothetical protein